MKLLYKFFLSLILVIYFCFPIFSFADDILEDPSSNVLEVTSNSIASEPPSINARHSVVLDRLSGTILYGKNENEKCKMASTTKILTAIVVIENSSDLSSIVTVSSKSAHTGGSRLGLSTDDKVSIKDLLYGLLMVSGNDAAVALAESVGNDVNGFSNLMNKKASDLGLSSSHFVTPHGLDDNDHYTTAYELAKIANYALKNDVFAKIVRTSNYTININGNPKNLHNTNELLGYLDGVYGVKTGFTNGANRCLVTACKRGNLDIICVVLGCDTKKDRTLDSVKLINYVFGNFTVVDVKSFIERDFNSWLDANGKNVFVDKGVYSELNFCLNESQILFDKIAVKNEDLENVQTFIDFSNSFIAPLDENSSIGSLTLCVGGNSCFSVDILCDGFVRRKGVMDYLKGFFEEFLVCFGE